MIDAKLAELLGPDESAAGYPDRKAKADRAIAAIRAISRNGDDAAALSLVISLNVQRRDLTAAQRAITAAKALPMFEEAAKGRMSAGGKSKGGTVSATLQRSRDDASKVFKVGVNAVQQAKAILADAPDLAQQVEGCTLSLANAMATVATSLVLPSPKLGGVGCESGSQ